MSGISYTVRDAVMWLSRTNLFRVRWSEHIHREWMDALEWKGHDHVRLIRIRVQMKHHNADALVTHYHPLIDSITLPDSDDRHVVEDLLASLQRSTLPQTVRLLEQYRSWN